MNGANILILLTVSYLASIYLHPYTSCGPCHGSGQHSGSVFTYSSRACERCDGSGRRIRIGARVLGRR